ncbi:MAG: hypothetical protein R6U78_02980, partial [Bacteroidales bacterium]
MIALKLAYRNLVGAGLRTFLIVFVLSVSYVLIIFMNGLYQGWEREGKFEMTRWEVGQGQYWQENYDPYDPVTLTDAHATLPTTFARATDNGNAAAILITQATVYPEGRMLGIMLKGISANQEVLAIPTDLLRPANNEIPAVIGTRFAETANLSVGDNILVRWRDVNGTFDATDLTIAGIFNSSVPAVDNGQIWVSLEKLQQMTGMPGEATLLVTGENTDFPAGGEHEKRQNTLCPLHTHLLPSPQLPSRHDCSTPRGSRHPNGIGSGNFAFHHQQTQAPAYYLRGPIISIVTHPSYIVKGIFPIIAILTIDSRSNSVVHLSECDILLAVRCKNQI